MNSEILMEILQHIKLDKNTLISLFKMDQTSEQDTYICCKKLCDNCECINVHKYLYRFVKLDYNNPTWLREFGIFNYTGHKYMLRSSNVNYTSDGYVYYSTFSYDTMDTFLGKYKINDKIITKFCFEIGSAIGYMNYRNIICGITMNNIGIIQYKNDYKFILTSFNRSKKIIPTRPILQTKYDFKCKFDSTYDFKSSWPPPEYIMGQDMTVKSDMWQFGCILLLLLCKLNLADAITMYNSQHKFTKLTDSRDVYIFAIKKSKLLCKIIKSSFDNNILLADLHYNSTRLDLYKTLICLCLKPNYKKRLTSRAIAITFMVPNNLYFYELPYIYKQRLRDNINVNVQCYKRKVVLPENIDIIFELVSIKEQYVLKNNPNLTGDDISMAIDMLWDEFRETPDNIHLHNSTVILFINFCHRTTIVNEDNIWLYMMMCKFIVQNLYGTIINISQFAMGQFEIDESSEAISFILITIRFKIISDIRW